MTTRIRTADNGAPWSEGRLEYMTTTMVRIDGELYPIVAAEGDGNSAILTVQGITLPSGTSTDLGIVE